MNSFWWNIGGDPLEIIVAGSQWADGWSRAGRRVGIWFDYLLDYDILTGGYDLEDWEKMFPYALASAKPEAT
jgi:hypothetical protein